MYANKVKKIAAVHDLSGMGRVSLTVVIPILSSMGFQVCPLPTAVLSNHTQYPGFSFLDLTDEMPKIIAQWKKLDESTSSICDKLFFVESDDRELAKSALFAIPTIQGNYLILPNEEQEESELNLELLFNATLAAPGEIARLFHTQK